MRTTKHTTAHKGGGIRDDEFLRRWALWYPAGVPLGYRMRQAYPDRWLRIHSLPRSKRYAESAEERQILLDRHNAAADVLLANAPCLLLGYDYQGAERLASTDPLSHWIAETSPIHRFAAEDEESEMVTVFGALIEWQPGALDNLLLDVADDRLRMMLLNWRTGAAYAPYDGGADLFLPTVAERERVRSLVQEWLPTRSDGL